jgi:hypothetical protein
MIAIKGHVKASTVCQNLNTLYSKMNRSTAFEYYVAKTNQLM